MHSAMKSLISCCIYLDPKADQVRMNRRSQLSSDFFDAVV